MYAMLTSYVSVVNIYGTLCDMPTRTRSNKPYHHGDLRQTLMEAACKHMREHSVDTLSLRALARDVGVSQTAPYRHFESKNALFAAIATWGFELMAKELNAARAKHADDVEAAIIEVGMTYVDWALRNPEKYQLFFDASLLDFSEYEELQQSGAAAFDVLLDLIREGQREHVFVTELPAEELAGAMWSSVHGLTSLVQKNHAPNFTHREADAVPQALQALASDTRTVMGLFLNSIKVPC